MDAANELVDIIKEIISQELSTRGTTEMAVIDSVGDSGCYNVKMISDQSTIIHNIPNMTNQTFVSGDACYVYKVDNNLANSYICYKKPAIGAQNAVVNIDTTAQTVVTDVVSDETSGESGGGETPTPIDVVTKSEFRKLEDTVYNDREGISDDWWDGLIEIRVDPASAHPGIQPVVYGRKVYGPWSILSNFDVVWRTGTGEEDKYSYVVDSTFPDENIIKYFNVATLPGESTGLDVQGVVLEEDLQCRIYKNDYSDIVSLIIDKDLNKKPLSPYVYGVKSDLTTVVKIPNDVLARKTGPGSDYTNYTDCSDYVYDNAMVTFNLFPSSTDHTRLVMSTSRDYTPPYVL